MMSQIRFSAVNLFLVVGINSSVAPMMTAPPYTPHVLSTINKQSLTRRTKSFGWQQNLQFHSSSLSSYYSFIFSITLRMLTLWFLTDFQPLACMCMNECVYAPSLPGLTPNWCCHENFRYKAGKHQQQFHAEIHTSSNIWNGSWQRVLFGLSQPKPSLTTWSWSSWTAVKTYVILPRLML